MSLFQVTQIAAADVPNPPVGTYTLFLDTADGVWKKKDSAGNVTQAAAGETNTASNVGTAGVGVFKQKTGVDFEFKKINAGSSKITITDDTGTSEVDVDVNEANLTVFSGAGTKGLVPDPTSATGKVLSDNASWVAPSSLYSANGTLAGARTVNMNSLALGFTNAAAGIGIGTATATASAILDLTSTTEGFLKPRMTGAQVEAIGSPATGLEVYATNAGSGDVTIAGWWVYNGSNWIPSGAGLTQIHSSQIQRYTESGGASVEFDDYDAGSYNALFLDPGAHDRDFTGIVAPATGVNRIIKIVNVGTSKKLKFKDNDTADSAAANCFYLPDRSNFDLEQGSSYQIMYDHNVSRWVSLSYY